MANVETQFFGNLVDGLQTVVAVNSYISVPDSHGIASLIAGAQVWGQALDAVTDGAFQRLEVVMQVPFPGGMKMPTGATWAASRASQTGVISFSSTGTGRRWGQAIPSLAQATISSGKVDITNAAIVALIDLLINPTLPFTNPEMQALEVALDALLSFRKYSYLAKSSLRAY